MLEQLPSHLQASGQSVNANATSLNPATQRGLPQAPVSAATNAAQVTSSSLGISAHSQYQSISILNNPGVLNSVHGTNQPRLHNQPQQIQQESQPQVQVATASGIINSTGTLNWVNGSNTLRLNLPRPAAASQQSSNMNVMKTLRGPTSTNSVNVVSPQQSFNDRMRLPYDSSLPPSSTAGTLPPSQTHASVYLVQPVNSTHGGPITQGSGSGNLLSSQQPNSQPLEFQLQQQGIFGARAKQQASGAAMLASATPQERTIAAQTAAAAAQFTAQLQQEH